MTLQVAPFTSAGSKLFVVSGGVLPATYDEAGYANLTWVECGFITEIPEFGETYNVNTLNVLGSRIVKKAKGSVDPGTIAVPMARVPGDPGQAILLAGVSSDKSYSFKVELNDDFTPSTGHPTRAYFTGKITSYPINVGGVDGFTMTTCSIGIDTLPVISVAT